MHKIFLVVIVIALVVGAWWMGSSGTFKFSQSEENKIATSTVDIFGKPTAPTTEAAVPVSGKIINNEQKITMNVTLHTNKGDIVIQFLPEQAPNTVKNFIKLAESKFYDGVKFHRVIKDFMIQGGDPLSKDDAHPELWGTGGPGYTILDELGPRNKNSIGTISMANAGPNTGGSQFFINTKDNNFLDDKHTVFGVVVKGEEVVRAIESTQTGQNDRPVEPIVIQSVSVE
ncbi:MAG: peptidylprolyl isomerase [Minisyncoccia bacterium]